MSIRVAGEWARADSGQLLQRQLLLLLAGEGGVVRGQAAGSTCGTALLFTYNSPPAQSMTWDQHTVRPRPRPILQQREIACESRRYFRPGLSSLSWTCWVVRLSACYWHPLQAAQKVRSCKGDAGYAMWYARSSPFLADILTAWVQIMGVRIIHRSTDFYIVTKM